MVLLKSCSNYLLIKILEMNNKWNKNFKHNPRFEAIIKAHQREPLVGLSSWKILYNLLVCSLKQGDILSLAAISNTITVPQCRSHSEKECPCPAITGGSWSLGKPTVEEDAPVVVPEMNFWRDHLASFSSHLVCAQEFIFKVWKKLHCEKWVMKSALYLKPPQHRRQSCLALNH